MSEVVTIELDKLYEPYFNPRKHPQEQLYNLSESLREFGQRRTISVWPDGKGKYEVLAGNGIKKAAELAKLKTLDCTIAPSEWDEVRRKAYALADNQGGYEDDMVKVAQILEEVRASGEIELAALGSNSEKVDALLEELANQALQDAKPGLGGDDFEIPEELEPKSKFGDVWQLGRHKIACIDSTNAEQVKWFLDGVKVSAIVTDVPYGISQKSNGLRELDYGEWDKGDCDKLALDALSLFKDVPSITAFCGDEQLSIILKSFKVTGRTCRTVGWVKPNPTVLNGEYVFLPALELAAHGRNPKAWFGGNCERSVWEGAAPQDRNHPTQKPLGLLEWLLLMTCPVNENAYDPFLGSGTTLIAAERTGRTCYGCEISPKYADVIIKRWEMEVGEGAQLLTRLERPEGTND